LTVAWVTHLNIVLLLHHWNKWNKKRTNRMVTNGKQLDAHIKIEEILCTIF